MNTEILELEMPLPKKNKIKKKPHSDESSTLDDKKSVYKNEKIDKIIKSFIAVKFIGEVR